MASLEIHFGIIFPEKVLKSCLYLLCQMNVDRRAVSDYGHTTSQLGPMSHFAYLLKKSKDSFLSWLYASSPGEADDDLLYFDDRLPPRDPSGCLPLVKLFWDMGQDFIVDGGKTDYYRQPWYQRFFIQPGAHNGILPDRNPECHTSGDFLWDAGVWKDYAQVTDFLDSPCGFGQVINVLTGDEEAVCNLELRHQANFLEMKTGQGRFFIRSSRGGSCEAGGIGTNALAMARLDGSILALRASEMKEGETPLFQATAIIRLRLERGEGSILLRLWGRSPIKIQIFFLDWPKAVELEGRPLLQWQHHFRYLSLEIPAEASRHQVRY